MIATLQHLIGSGDKVERVEGIFSGTLSFIFNTLGTGEGGGDGDAAVLCCDEARCRVLLQPGFPGGAPTPLGVTCLLADPCMPPTNGVR